MDLSKVNYCSSAGIGILVNIRASCQSSGGGLVLIKPADCLDTVLKTFGIRDLFAIVPDKAKAIETLKALPAQASPAAKP
jgi:anti-anti-sigma factor